MELFHNLPSSVTLLTPNRRLAVYYSKQYHQYQLQQASTIWKTLDILPLNSWLERSWNDYIHDYVDSNALLLNANQELILWEKIISKSPESDHLLQVAATAELAKSAWGILKAWCIPLDHASLSMTEDSHAFLKWATEFQNECHEKKWLDTASLASQLIHQIENNKIKTPQKLILIGFTEISPQYQSLLEAYEKTGTEVIQYAQKRQHNKVHKISLTDKETEIKTMALWAKALLEQTEESKKRIGMIGCIVPNLEDHRELVSRIFTEVFTEKGYYTNNSLNLPFNISAGKNLATYPVIHTALQLLDLHTKNIPIETLSHILHSPFLGDSEKEMLRRAEFTNQLRRENIHSMSLTEFVNRNNKPELLAKRIKKYLEKIDQIHDALNISEWVNTFIELLTILGWPGERSVNSEEYQLIQRWMDILNEYNTFETLLRPTGYKTALQYLKRLTGQTVFQIQSPETPIQILGILEAAEIPFDQLWVMGMDDTTWPPSPKPNPFIPQQLQKTCLMPHATAERELQFCTLITEQLTNSADTVIFSHPLHDAETEVRASSLLNTFSEMNVHDLLLPMHVSPATYSYSYKKIEKLSDNIAPSLNINASITGGAKIFELQAACPFRAFAELRLHARPIDTTSPGLRALDKGNIVHKALELIWTELKDSTTLMLKSDEELKALITSGIQQAIYKVTDGNQKNSHYLKLELQRLEKIVWDWLTLEKQRPPFRVLSQEQSYDITIANISITLRIDRVDELADNEHFIIDYKTGKNNHIYDWFGNRPAAPQLPLYCILDPVKIAGIAFATIHTEKMEFHGASRGNLNIASVKNLAEINNSDANFWGEQLVIWRQTLEKLGTDFYEGIAYVDPKDGLQTCEHCKLKSLCRIYEKQTMKSETEQSAADITL